MRRLLPIEITSNSSFYWQLRRTYWQQLLEGFDNCGEVCYWMQAAIGSRLLDAGYWMQLLDAKLLDAAIGCSAIGCRVLLDAALLDAGLYWMHRYWQQVYWMHRYWQQVYWMHPTRYGVQSGTGFGLYSMTLRERF